MYLSPIEFKKDFKSVLDSSQHLSSISKVRLSGKLTSDTGAGALNLKGEVMKNHKRIFRKTVLIPDLSKVGLKLNFFFT